jgi:DNA-binding XRE family transcriptional regulator
VNNRDIQEAMAEKYKPVPHTAEDDAKLFSDPLFKEAYDLLADEYAALAALLQARKEAGLTQAQVAERMGIKQPTLARIESSLSSRKHSPSLETLRKYASACGKRLEIHLV